MWPRLCAEAAAIAEMLKHRETHILSVVAVAANGSILSPCGRCREMIAQVNPANLDAQILLEVFAPRPKLQSSDINGVSWL